MDELKEDDPILDADEDDEDFVLGEDNDEDDVDDDDYVPEGGNNSDSDPEYGGKRKRKSSSSSSPSKKSQRSSSTKASSTAPKKSPGRKKKTGAKSSPPKKKKTTRSNSKTAAALSPRRSSRSTRARAVSYADADVSEEEFFAGQDVSESEEDEEKVIKNAKKKEAKKKHVDDLWSSFKADTGVKKSAETNVDIPTDTDANSDKEKPKAAVENVDVKEQQIDDKIESSKNDGKEPSGSNNKIEDVTSKKEEPKIAVSVSDKCDTDVKDTPLAKQNSNAQANEQVKPSEINKNDSKQKQEEKDLIKEESKLKTSDTSAEKEGPSTTDKEKIQAQISNPVQSSAAAAVPIHPSKGLGAMKKSGGLAGIVGGMKDKKRTSILEQSKSDWNGFKSSEGLEDELRANRSSGYLDKQEFLQRVDYKQWENEREMRLYSNRK